MKLQGMTAMPVLVRSMRWLEKTLAVLSNGDA